ncbi:hypothetical protein HU200_000889 [Digitaria exilis]|uniref:Uncharacterized protein n=1 Tax=Digitaria exilis TaxID=1010633 RepID=A0A835KV67_9POAL|nr:hypothetical protein HU200_000889 [Digitaria exilis]
MPWRLATATYSRLTSLFKKNKRIELKLEAPDGITWKKEAASCEKDNGNGKDGSITVRNEYPRHPAPCFELNKFMLERYVSIAKSIANDIIIPDPTPQWVCDTFLDKYAQLEPILQNDSVQRFLRSFFNCAGKGMSWNLTITAQTLTFMISYNALRCAKVVLEGKAPKLYGMHANPNCINTYGYFPIHEAAERFSVDMIKLLLRHGASANVRTVGNDVIEDLLPLHVAVENTRMHKYLEDNLSPSLNHLNYIYKLICLLSLPEMKIFLDTTRLLAGKTNNLLEELWKYIEDGKLIQTAVLLLAAQEQIRGGCSSMINGSCKKHGFAIISNRLLVDVISHAGGRLSSYIQAHSEVSDVSPFLFFLCCTLSYRRNVMQVAHMEVLEHVSSILKEYGFRPTEAMDTINLRPYDCKASGRDHVKVCWLQVLLFSFNKNEP